MMDISLRERQVRFWYQDGLAVKEGHLQVPSPILHDFNSCYLFSFAKSGSVLVNNILKDMCAVAGVTCFSLSEVLYGRGIATSSCLVDYVSLLSEKGYCFCGFRGVPESMRGLLEVLPGRKALLVRDPRDMLVSLYFSMKSSHSFPPQMTRQFENELRMSRRMTEMSLDEFCLTASPLYFRKFMDTSNLIKSGAKIFRYEDFIYDKVKICRSLRDHFDIRVSDEDITRIALRHDDVPAEDRPDSHVRQVHPGDHRRKLRADTIEALNAALQRFIAFFDYA